MPKSSKLDPFLSRSVQKMLISILDNPCLDKKGEHMKRTICLSLAFVLALLVFMTPTWAFDIAGWWAGRSTYQQGDFVTGDWTSLPAAGKKASYLYIFQQTANTGTAYLLIWDDASSDYLLETYNLYIKNNVIVLYVPTFFDPTTGGPAAATLVLKPTGSSTKSFL